LERASKKKKKGDQVDQFRNYDVTERQKFLGRQRLQNARTSDSFTNVEGKRRTKIELTLNGTRKSEKGQFRGKRLGAGRGLTFPTK